MRKYSVYKGLQKPLVFRGFKGRYIYWGVGFIVLSLVAGGILGAFVGMLPGAATMAALMLGGIYYTGIRQKQGLYDKKRAKGVHVIRTELKGRRNVKKESV